jgi:peptidylprolyl isomerase
MRTGGKIVMAAVVAVGLVSCSSADNGTPAGATTSAPTVEVRSTAPAGSATASTLPACTADDITVTGAAGSKPTITVPDTCSQPTQLLSKDLVVGTGPEVTVGVTMQTHYDLVTWSDKRELDSSWSRGEPFPLQDVGRAHVIDGWNEGLLGMRQGGRRLLVVPPDKGYGQGGNGIRPGETLVFVVDAVQVVP